MIALVAGKPADMLAVLSAWIAQERIRSVTGYLAAMDMRNDWNGLKAARQD